MTETDRATELERSLEEISYQVTAARTAGVNNPSELRNAFKRLRQLVNDGEAFAATLEAERLKAREES
jgi:hypothetical protein